MAEHHNRKLFVGLGSFHGDDQVGWLIAEQLQSLNQIPVRTATVPADLLHYLDGLDALYLCDACQGPDPIGTVHRWDWRNRGTSSLDVVTLRSSNSHQLSLPETLQLAENLKMLPANIVLWAVDAKEFGAGQPPSEELMMKLPNIVARMAGELAHA